ncbi:MAG: YidH family protein [Candidatus Limnocylindria bacterium]
MDERGRHAADRDRPPDSAARDHLANTRTLLAWIRTAIALMGLGFVVARFGLFLRELAVMAPAGATGSTNPGLSLGVGIGLVVTGLLITGLSTSRFVSARRAIERGEFKPDLFVELVLVAVTVAGGVALVANLALAR